MAKIEEHYISAGVVHSSECELCLFSAPERHTKHLSVFVSQLVLFVLLTTILLYVGAMFVLEHTNFIIHG